MASRTVVQHSEELNRAIKWLATQLEESPDRPVGLLVSDAGPKFNLSPSDQEALMHIAKKFRNNQEARPPK